MAVLAYTSYSSVNDAKDLLSKFRTFAVAQGWTSVEYQTSVAWRTTTPFGWIAGDEDFLELYSTGFGFQNLRYRFRVDPYDAQEQTLFCCPVDPNYPTYSYATTHPVIQNTWQGAGYRMMSLPAASFPGCWFFGNEKFLMAIIRLTTTQCASFAIGTIDLFPELRGTTELQCHWPGCYNATQGGVGGRWYSISSYETNWFQCMSWIGVVGSSGYVIWLESTYRAEAHYRLNVTAARNSDPTGYFNRLPYCTVLNSFTAKRVALTPTVFFKNNTTGIWYPAGNLWTVELNYAGLAMGDTVEYGDDDYLAFPNLLQSYTYGIGVRVG